MTLRHHGQHPADECAPCRWKTVAVDPRATPSRMNTVPPARSQFNGWERGIVTDRRPDGSEMPLLNAKGHPVGVKTYAENRHQIDEARRRVAHDPSVLTRKR